MILKQVLEYQWIGKGETVSLTDSQLAYLDRAVATNVIPANAVEWQRNRLRFCGWCGVISLGDLTLEILPKIHGKENNSGTARKLLVVMLSAVRKLDLRSTGEAELSLQKMVLLDLFILSFAEKVDSLVRRGIPRSYIPREENLAVVRGKILVGRQIRENVCHRNRIWCGYDEFLEDTVMNRIIKVTLKHLYRFARSLAVQQKLEQLRAVYADITDAYPCDADWERLSFDRTNEEWQVILNQCRWFLSGMSPDIFSGSEQSISLLFAMNLLFEEYIAVELKKALGDTHEVLAQKPQKKLLQKADGTRLFTMKPDLFVRSKKTGLPVAILDTKWKLLNAEERKLGISQADLYQMYTYAGTYNVPQVLLLYPCQAGNDIIDSLWSFTGEGRGVGIVQIDLEKVLKGRRIFREYLREIFFQDVGLG